VVDIGERSTEEEALLDSLRRLLPPPLDPMSIVSPPLTAHFAPLATGYDVVLSDVWGVVHNGAVAFAEACDALARFRDGGGTVVLITNAPRPGQTVARSACPAPPMTASSARAT
jgi:Haloacid dehalogenase-like hydrolase